MGFFFRRSASFGPLRLNFSKSGVGASVGVKGARLTVSPKGFTYITVGQGGFYYRQSLATRRKVNDPRPKTPLVQEQRSFDEIRTADVTELMSSSKSELVESLNKRAGMFNPGILLFLLSGVCLVLGLGLTMESGSADIPIVLPNVSALSDELRQANRTDEYALSVARYGEPSTVSLRAGPVPVRVASYADVHVALVYVPVGCVDAYTYSEAHKGDFAVRPSLQRRSGRQPIQAADAPRCKALSDFDWTIVGYQDGSGAELDHVTAQRLLSNHGARFDLPPSVQAAPTSSSSSHTKRSAAVPQSVHYNITTFNTEQRRLNALKVGDKEDGRLGLILAGSSLILFIPGVLVHLKNKEARMTRLVYDLSGSASTQHESLEKALNQLADSNQIWRVDSKWAISDWKRNAGAAYNVKRESIRVHKTTPPRVVSNVIPICLDLGTLKMYFLPDQILYWQQGIFASLDYKELSFQAGSTRFIEEWRQTADSEQVGSTWRYVRKDGGPDHRFNNNQQMPIMLYGVITASSSSGLNLVFHTSSLTAANSFATCFRTFQSDRQSSGLGEGAVPRGKSGPDEPSPIPSFPAEISLAMNLLGVTGLCTAEQLNVAYRQQAQQYHPDKVVGLGPEIQALAEERMKAVNAAHLTLKQYLGVG